MPGVYQVKSHSYEVDLVIRMSTYIESIKLVNARIGPEQYTLTPSIWALVCCRSTFKIVYRCHFITSFHSVVSAFIASHALLSFSTLNLPVATSHGFCFCRPLSDIDIAPASLHILTFSPLLFFLSVCALFRVSLSLASFHLLVCSPTDLGSPSIISLYIVTAL